MSSYQTSLKTFSALAVTLVALSCICSVALFSDDSEAARTATGTATVGEYYSESFNLSDEYGEELNYVNSGMTSSSSKGLSASITPGDFDGETAARATISVSGTPTSAGTATFTGYLTVLVVPSGEDSRVTFTVTITIEKAASTPVTSISISGSSSGDVGDTIILTATTSPSSATDRTVTWSITSGSSRASITSQTDTSTGGRCVISLESAGSVTVKATANDGSGASKTKTITISNPEYTCYLKYNANGGSGAPTIQSYTGTSTSNHTFTISSVEPTRSGYNFMGWSTSSSATSAAYEPGDTISVGYNSTRTLYAVWGQITYTHTLVYNANGGSGAPNSSTITNTSSSYSMTISTTQPTRSGYNFLGWATSSGATAATHQPGGTVSVGANSTVTLYAVWQEAVIEITSSPASTAVIVGQEWLYSVSTDVPGCTISVSGAPWLSVSGSSISGTPTTAGTYTITITADKTGYTPDVQTISLTVVSALQYTNEPSNGASIYVL